jgi:uncharacterized membrane protein YoaK (UPF0700 family)
MHSADGQPWKRGVESIRHPLTRALLALTFTTGLVDAVSYLGLGRVFTANMTGNVVLLGFGVAGSGGLPVIGPLVSLAAFLLGSNAGGVLVQRMSRHTSLMASALSVEVGLITVAAVFAGATHLSPNSVLGDLVISLMALAMGVRNAVVQSLGVPDLTTTVLTQLLSRFAAQSPLAGASGKGSVRRLAAVVAMFAGALAGALLLKASLAFTLAVAAALALLTALLYVPAAVRIVGSPPPGGS